MEFKYDSSNEDKKQQRRKKLDRRLTKIGLCIFIWFITIPFTVRLPIIPNPILKENMGWLTYIILTSLSIFYLFVRKGPTGRSHFIESLERADQQNKKGVFCLILPIYTSVFYLLGVMLTLTASVPASFIEGTVTQHHATITNISKASGWYRGTSKVGIQLKDNSPAFGIYYPNDKINQYRLSKSQTVIVTQNHTLFGTHIRNITPY